MAIPIKLGVTDHVGFTGTLPDPPRLPGANASQQAALDQWWANARGKIQSDSRDIKQTIEDIYRKLGTSVTNQTGTVINNYPTVDPGYYLHEQRSPASTWIIPHNLGQKPVIALLSKDGEEIVGSVVHVDENNSIARYNFDLTGYAICT